MASPGHPRGDSIFRIEKGRQILAALQRDVMSISICGELALLL